MSKCFVSVDFQGFIQALFGELPPQTSEISPISEVCMMTFCLLIHVINFHVNRRHLVSPVVITIITHSVLGFAVFGVGQNSHSETSIAGTVIN